MSWLAITVPFLVGLILLFVPGLLVAVSMKLRGFDAFGIAPALSVSFIAISAIVAPMVGISWSLWVPFAFALVIALVAFGVNLIVLRISSPKKSRLKMHRAASRSVVEESSTSEKATVVSSRWFSKEQGLYWISFLIGAVLLLRNVTNSIGQPDWISQTYDNIFHQNVVRYIADTGNASSLFVASMTSGGEPAEFYPAAWHDIVSLTFMYGNGANIAVSTNAVAVLTCTVIWPLSIIFMVRSIVRIKTASILTIGIFSAGFVAFPLLLINFGVLYPNLLGIALSPIGIALVAQLFQVVPIRYFSTTQTIFIGIFVALGIALAHPNAIMSLLVLIIPVFVTRAVIQVCMAIKQSIAWWIALLQVVGIACILWFINYLWGVVRPPKESGGWLPETTQAQGFGEFILNAVVGQPVLWFVSFCAFIGLIKLLVTPSKTLWIVGMWGVLAYFYMAIRYLDWDHNRDWVVGVWYHDPYRVAALLPIVMVPLCVIGVDLVVQLVLESRAFSAYKSWAGSWQRAHHIAENSQSVISVGLVVLLLFATGFYTQTAKPLKDFIEGTYWLYYPDDDSVAGLLTSQEENVLEHVDDYVPEDATIMVQPWTGSALAYSVANRKVSAYHTNFTDTELTGYLNQHLNQALTDPTVCDLIQENNAYYYLDFGTQEVQGGSHAPRFSGYEDASNRDHMTKLYSDGEATLYEISACR